jgi:glycosyltransferase involved in cell wall biosynthesis
VRVGVDATSWVNRRGFGRFARNAIGRLVELDRQTTYVFTIDDESAPEAQLPAGVEVRRVVLRRTPSEAAAAGSSRSPTDLLKLTRAVRSQELDVFLFPSTYTWFPVVGAPTLVGVHDTILEDLPKLTVPTRRHRMLARRKQSLAIRRASRLFTVSNASRRSVSERWRVPAERIAVVPEAPDPVFVPRSGNDLERGLAEAGLERGERFFLFWGGISPHKNAETLIDVYALLCAQLEDAPLLVLVGDLEADSFLSSAANVRARIAAHGLEASVRLPGYVPDGPLACLCSAATAVVIPSLAEGFGLPAVEAAACGAPLLLSDLPAHRETLEGAALFFPPKDADALAGLLARVSRDEGLREDLGARARKAVAPLTWDASAERLRGLLFETAGLA